LILSALSPSALWPDLVCVHKKNPTQKPASRRSRPSLAPSRARPRRSSLASSYS
jgi:hypothetical protein